MKNYIFTLLFLIIANVAFSAPDASIKSGGSEKISEDISNMYRNSVEKRDSGGKRKSTTNSKGNDKTTSDSTRSSTTKSSAGTLDTTISFDTIITSHIISLEHSGVEPFASCKLVSKPKLGADFGLSAKINGGGIDTIRAQYLSALAQNNGNIAEVADIASVIAYKQCLIEYGSIYGQTLSTLNEIISDFGKGENITMLGIIDLENITAQIVDSIVKDGINDKNILHLVEKTKFDTECFFAGSLTSIKCGESTINIVAAPTLAVGRVDFFGQAYAGRTGSWKVSKSFNLADAIEKMKSISKYSKFASDVQRYTEGMESKGQNIESSIAKKKAIEKVKSNDKSVGIASFFPSIH